MIFQSTTPILYSSDIERSIKYYTEILGFADSWKWDDPPTFGGVNHNGFNIYFCKDGQGHPGTWIAINVDEVDAYHDLISQKGATIVNPPQTMEWGLREMLVKDPDDHYIRFGQPVSLRQPGDKTLPADVHFIDRAPTLVELKKLTDAVGWSSPEEKPPPDIPITSIAYVVIAEDKQTREVIGCAFLLTDNAGFYYVKNVIVHHSWQGMQVGNGLMQRITNWLDKNAPDKSLVALHTGENLAPFYRKFGFAPGFSMLKRIRKTSK